MAEVKAFTIKVPGGEDVLVEGEEARFSGGLLIIRLKGKDVVTFLPGFWSHVFVRFEP